MFGERINGRLRSWLLGVLVLSVGAGTATLLAVTTGAEAASPLSGTVSDGSPTVTWTGGPFLAPNTTGNVLDDPTCTLPTTATTSFCMSTCPRATTPVTS